MSTTADVLTPDSAELTAAFAAYKGQTAPPAPVLEAQPSTPVASLETPPPVQPSADAAVQPPAEPESTEPAQEPGQEPGVSKRKAKLERRFSELTRDRDAAEARARTAEEELRQLKAVAVSPPPAAAQPAPKEIKEPVEPQAPDLTEMDYEAAQKAMLQYSKDVAAYSRAVKDYSKQVAEREVAQARIALETERRTAEQTKAIEARKVKWQAEVQRGLKVEPDFAEICDKTVGPVLSALGMDGLIIGSGVGPEMMIWLDDNPEEFNRIKALPSPVEVAEALGEVKATVKAIAAQKKQRSPAASPALPPPPATVGGAGSGSIPSIQQAEELPQAEFNAYFKKLLKG